VLARHEIETQRGELEEPGPTPTASESKPVPHVPERVSGGSHDPDPLKLCGQRHQISTTSLFITIRQAHNGYSSPRRCYASPSYTFPDQHNGRDHSTSEPSDHSIDKVNSTILAAESRGLQTQNPQDVQISTFLTSHSIPVPSAPQSARLWGKECLTVSFVPTSRH
jgi:hypothetical protein